VPTPIHDIVIRGADAELLTFPDGSSMHLLADRNRTRDTAAMSVHRSVLAAGADGPSPHHHRATTELIYVLSGTLELLVDNCIAVASHGDLVVIPPGVSHAFGASPGCEVEVLDIATPGGARFEWFRHLSRVANGSLTASPQPIVPAPDDTYADISPAWRSARSTEARTR